MKNVVWKSIRYHPPPFKRTHPYKYCHTYTHLWRRWIKFTPPCSYLKKVASELWKRWTSTNSFAKLIIFQNNIEAWEVLCFTSVINETPNRVTLNEECNDLNHKNSSLEKIANETGNMTILWGMVWKTPSYKQRILEKVSFLMRRLNLINVLLKNRYF